MRWLRGFSIRARITIQTIAVALILCSVAVVLLRLSVEAVLESATTQLLENDAGPFEAEIRTTPKRPVITVAEDQLVAVVSPKGTLVTSTLPARLHNHLADLEKFTETPRILSVGSHSYLGRLESVATPQGTWLVITVRDREQTDLVLQRLTLTLLVGDLILVVGFGAAAWLLTGAALRPVNRMRRDAERLSTTVTLDELPIDGPHDELYRLAETLNTFIETNRRTIERERQMVSDASHELRTPIAILSGQLELAATEGRSIEEMREEVLAARRTATRLSTLTTNLLELAKIESGQANRATTFGVLMRELAAAIDRARLLVSGRDVAVDFDVHGIDDDEAGYPLSAAAFGIAVDNLLTNAIMAVDAGGSVQVVAAQREHEVEVSVTDDGPGMPPDFIPLAFDRFTRPDGARQRSVGGSGLGLAIVHAIVTSAHGTAQVENQDPGLRVSFLIPRSAAAR
jgi:two-component system OmpR family sensor kinase